MRVVIPTPPISDAPDPIKVRFQINWEPPFNSPTDAIESGWAIAWASASTQPVSGRDTGPAGLVIWRSGSSVASAWLPADHIHRQ